MAELRVRLKEILADRGLTQNKLSELSGVRPNIISEMSNNQRSSINREHVAAVAKTLNITDMNELFKIIDNEKE
ncbi:helix-turn-helix domain-containing protein [Viridibacillus sp. NPDC096237]|uniref:helix-turn-helix domain-containing protein n=1 Tax=Viridibacillus sp. NPDC096237 TaxID=3390721 RepID=UPI003D073374